MKKLMMLAAIICGIVLLSCEKDEEKNNSGFQTTYQVSYPDRIFLSKGAETDSSITLRWTKLDADCFHRYSIYREISNDSSNIITYYSGFESIEDVNKLTFTDNNLPMASSIKYQIVAESCNGNFTSNLVFKKRDDIYTLELYELFDVIVDKEANNAYFVDNGNYSQDIAKIVRVNYEDFDDISTIYTNSSNMKYGCINLSNGKNKELCIPFSSYYESQIAIYDANSLTQIDMFNYYDGVHSVVSSNNILYLGVEDSYEPVKAYARNGFDYISGQGDYYFYEGCRLGVIPGTSTELFGVANYSDYIGYFKFDASGNAQEYEMTNTSNSYPSTHIFKVSPDGSTFVTGSRGYIHDNTLGTPVNTLSNSNSYSDFDFNNDGSKIYACNQDLSKIDVYSVSSNYSLVETIETVGAPKKVFYDNGVLYVLSKVEDSYDSYTYAIEKF